MVRKNKNQMNYITIDKKKCKACYLCVETCPKRLIKKGTEANILGHFPVDFDDPQSQCIGCAMCAMRCPYFAIT